MSFEELAEARGVTKPSAIKLVRRHGWRRQRDNQGHVRALVPAAWLTPEETREPDSTGDGPADRTTDVSRIINVLQTAVASLTERAQAAERRADQAEARADHAEQDRRRADERADSLQAELTNAHEALAGAEMRLREAEAARAEFWAKSRWRRIRAVWSGRG